VLLAALATGVATATERVGVVSDLSGPLLATTADGSIKVLAVSSSLEPGETLISRPETYAQVTFADHSLLTLGPDTELTIEKYSFHEAAPQDDLASLRLLKGRVRVVTGVLGTRPTDSFTLLAATATMDIRRSTMIAQYVPLEPSEVTGFRVDPQVRRAPILALTHSRGAYGYLPVANRDMRLSQLAPMTLPAHSPGLPAGLYVQVIDGAIHLSNGGGAQNFSAGQFGYTASMQQPPIVLPANPGLKFTPPPTFSQPTSSSGSNSSQKSNPVDCVVR
jgi:FecR protein